MVPAQKSSRFNAVLGVTIWSRLYRTWGTVAERSRSEPLRLAADAVLVAVETVRVTGG